MTSEKAKKTFETIPSEIVTDYVNSKIKNQSVQTQVDKSLRMIIPDEITLAPTRIEEEKEENLCPTCKNNLVFVEGCSLCIECGFSGCTSG